MSKESFTVLVVGMGVLFVVFAVLWFSPNSVLRFKLPKKEVVNRETDQPSLFEEKIPDELVVDIDAVEYRFSQKIINVNGGQKVILNFHNRGVEVHDFVIEIDDKKYATKVLEPGMTETVEFVADRVGEYNYYCSIPGHREQGMEGKLVVR